MNNNLLNNIEKTTSNKKIIIQITAFFEFLIFSYLLTISSSIFEKNIYVIYVLLSIGLILTSLLFIISYRSNNKTDQLISIILTFQAWALFLLILFISNGIYSPFFLGYIFVIYLSYILLNNQIIWMNGIVSILSSTILLVLQNNSSIKLINYFQSNPNNNTSNIFQVYFFNIFFILFFTILLQIIDKQISLKETNNSNTIDEYLKNNDNLTNNLVITNEKLSEITKELFNSEQYSEVLSILLEPITIEQQWLNRLEEPLKLLEEITQSIHCGVYLLDKNKEWASLQLSSNQFGKELIEKEHRYHISSDNIIISSIQYNLIQRKRNIGLDSFAFQENPFIESNYIIVFPIYYQGNVLGVIEFQNKFDNNISDFDEKYISNIAIIYAILIQYYNKPVYTDSKNNLINITSQNTNNWIPTEKSDKVLGYVYQQGNINKINKESNIDFSHLDQNYILQNNDSEVTIPIKISDQIIASILCEKRNSKEKWKKEEIKSLQIIADQLAIAITSAKLKQEIEKIKKQTSISSEISSELRKSVDIETLLQNAVRKIGTSLNANNVSIRLLSDSNEEKENL